MLRANKREDPFPVDLVLHHAPESLVDLTEGVRAVDERCDFPVREKFPQDGHRVFFAGQPNGRATKLFDEA
jgi:hypothetical protein